MKILQDGTINIETIEELKVVEQFVKIKGLDKFKLKIGTYESYVKSSGNVTVADFKDYAGVLSKVESLNLIFSSLDIGVIEYCKNLKQITIPFSYDTNQLLDKINLLNGLTKLQIASSSIGVLTSPAFPKNVEDVTLRMAFKANNFSINEENKMVAFNNDFIQNCSTLKKFSILNFPFIYYYCLYREELESLSLINNLNLTRISLPKNLGNLKELKIYANNPVCDFDAWRVAEIIRANYKGENKLKKFVFDIGLYPEVIRILEKDLKNDKFKAVFDDLVFTGETMDQAFNEYSAKQMQIYDKKITAIIKGCGITKNDTDFEAFAKIYLFMISNFKYNRETIKNGQRKKVVLVAKDLIGSANFLDNIIMLGKGYNSSNTFGALSADFTVICAGYCKFLHYLLNKVGIKNFKIAVMAGTYQELQENRSKDLADKSINHVILRVDFDAGSIYVDPTYDVNVYRANVSLNDLSFAGNIESGLDNFLESKFYIAKNKLLPVEAIKELLNIIKVQDLKMKNKGDCKMSYPTIYAKQRFDSNLSSDYNNDFNYVNLNKKSYFELEREI